VGCPLTNRRRRGEPRADASDSLSVFVTVVISVDVVAFISVFVTVVISVFVTVVISVDVVGFISVDVVGCTSVWRSGFEARTLVRARHVCGRPRVAPPIRALVGQRLRLR